MLKLKLRQDTIDKKTNENRTDIIIKEKTSNKVKSLPTNNSYFKKGQEFYEEAVNELKEILNTELISEASLETLSLFEYSQLRFSTIHITNTYSIKDELKEEYEKQEKTLKELEKRTLKEIEKIDKLKNLYSLNLVLIEEQLEDLVIKFNNVNSSESNKFSPNIYSKFAKKSEYIASKHNERKELINDIFGSENINFKKELAAEQKYTKEAKEYYTIYSNLKNT